MTLPFPWPTTGDSKIDSNFRVIGQRFPLGAEDLADNSVGAAEIIAGAVGTSEIADSNVTLAKMADDSVGAAEIIAGAVGTSELALGPTYVTALPASPVDGQEVYYAADAANGVIWHLRYRAAASGSYKWDFLGGPALQATVDNYETLAGSLSYRDLATVGPTVTTPLAGDYTVEHGAYIEGTAHDVVMSYAIGATAAVDADWVRVAIGAGLNIQHPFRSKRKTALPASTALQMKYSTRNPSTVAFNYRRIAIWPVRLG